MKYLLTILYTPIQDKEFLVHFNRFMSPILETDGKYAQFSNGLMFYYFDTLLDLVGIRDHLSSLNQNFGIKFILNEVNDTTTVCFNSPEIELFEFFEDKPFFIEPQENSDILSYEDEFSEDEEEIDDVVQKLLTKYRVTQFEPSIDEILEKIHEKGISSLSIQELAILKHQ